VLTGLLEAFGISAELGAGVLISLDKLDKQPADEVAAELTGRGLDAGEATKLVGMLTAPDSVDQLRVALKQTETGTAGLDEVDTMLSLVSGQVPADRIAFTPRMVRGLSYYTGSIWEVVAPGVSGSIGSGGRYDHLIAQLGGPDVPATGSSIGVDRILPLLPGSGAPAPDRLDVAVAVLSHDLAKSAFDFAATARSVGLRSSVYLGGSGKLGRQLKWASDSGARWCLIYGAKEHEAGTVTVRDMGSGDQADVAVDELGRYLAAVTGLDS
jgi:histidyl-tRNA synthetase